MVIASVGSDTKAGSLYITFHRHPYPLVFHHILSEMGRQKKKKEMGRQAERSSHFFFRFPVAS